MIVQVLCGNRYSPRERIFDAVIDKVEVKTLGELSPREIEHDNPEMRRVDELAHFLGQLYNRDVVERRRRDADSLLADPERPRCADVPRRERPLLRKAHMAVGIRIKLPGRRRRSQFDKVNAARQCVRRPRPTA